MRHAIQASKAVAWINLYAQAAALRTSPDRDVYPDLVTSGVYPESLFWPDTVRSSDVGDFFLQGWDRGLVPAMPYETASGVISPIPDEIISGYSIIPESTTGDVKAAGWKSDVDDDDGSSEPCSILARMAISNCPRAEAPAMRQPHSSTRRTTAEQVSCDGRSFEASYDEAQRCFTRTCRPSAESPLSLDPGCDAMHNTLVEALGVWCGAGLQVDHPLCRERTLTHQPMLLQSRRSAAGSHRGNEHSRWRVVAAERGEGVARPRRGVWSPSSSAPLPQVMHSSGTRRKRGLEIMEGYSDSSSARWP
mmetsp:Transcript_33893/g.97516  ORF Transcript_33893/g.97516 Transcript_33893/m.97516 type:complete len:306 (-) Transcript_33893:183-1100(-)